MKKTIVLIVVLILAGLVLAGWDEIPRQKANPDIATFLIPVPADVIDLHGNTDRTKVMYNIAFLRQVCANYEKQIKALETSVADLTKRVVDIDLKVDAAASITNVAFFDTNGVQTSGAGHDPNNPEVRQ